jgi:CelD/BcsL family acetyltransferase involved in cellulose biosynthesis
MVATHRDRQLIIQRLDAEGLRQLDRRQWDRLAANALVENPFYAAQQVVAAIDTIDADLDMRAIAIRDANGQLVGLFPYSRRNRSRYPLPMAFGATNDFQYSSTPLVDRDRADDVVDFWLDDMARGAGRLPWVLRHLTMDAPLARLIMDGAAARGFAVEKLLPYQRAVLTRLPGGFEAHLEAVLSKNRLKDVRRTMRRLAELGTLTFEHAEAPELVNDRIEDFLTLEHSGWKREQGTSILSSAEDAEFFRRAYRASEANRGFVTVDTLLLDGQPIAMKLSLRSGETAFTPKIAYDETHRKLGPGMALEYKLLEAFYAAAQPLSVDAAATAAGHSALGFFNEQHEVAILVFGASRWQVKLFVAAYKARELVQRLRAANAARGGALPEPAKAEAPMGAPAMGK